MAIIPWERVINPEEGTPGQVFRWLGMSANDCGKALPVVRWTDNTFQIFGTGPVTMRGSLKRFVDVNPTTAGDWMNMSDYDGTAATLTTAGTGLSLKQNTVTLSPLAGGGVTTVDVYVLIGSSR